MLRKENLEETLRMLAQNVATTPITAVPVTTIPPIAPSSIQTNISTYSQFFQPHPAQTPSSSQKEDLDQYLKTTLNTTTPKHKVVTDFIARFGQKYLHRPQEKESQAAKNSKPTNSSEPDEPRL